MRNVFKDLYQLAISDGEIAQMLEKSASKLQPEHYQLLDQIRGSPGVHLDETGWKEQGENQAVWAITPTNKETAVFKIGYGSKGIALPKQAESQKAD